MNHPRRLLAPLALVALAGCGSGPEDPRVALDRAATALSGPLVLDYEAALDGGAGWRAVHEQLDPEAFRVVVPRPDGEFRAGSDGSTFWALAPGDPPELLTLDAALLPLLATPSAESVPVDLAEVDAPGFLRRLFEALQRSGAPLAPADPEAAVTNWELPASALPFPVTRPEGTARVEVRLGAESVPTAVVVRLGDRELYRFAAHEVRVPAGFPAGTFAFVPPRDAKVTDLTAQLAPDGVQEALSSLGY